MTYEAVTATYEDIPENWREELPNNGCGKEGAYYIVVSVDGEIQTVESDAMEPKDARFFRNLGWIEFELNRAYMIGLEDGGKV